jgi:transcriptional regulator with GAF, ATPase, and Fis domain
MPTDGSEVERYDKLLGAQLEEVHWYVDRAGPSSTTVLIQGESGTGKELVAEALHWRSQRKGELVRLNCGAIPEGLVDSELFGHERGSFTGADAGRAGHFEAANNGTLFLDEVGNMPPRLQARLLRVLQSGAITRIGSSKPKPLNVRVLAATNADLWAMCERGEFRKDLYYRLNVVSIVLKPLRERRDDILLLADAFLLKYLPSARFALCAIEAMQAYEWPGNVRELDHAVQRAALFCDGIAVRAKDLGIAIRTPDAPSVPTLSRMDEVERDMLVRALEAAGGVQRVAAATLGITERVMSYKVHKFGIVNTLRRPGGKGGKTQVDSVREQPGVEGVDGPSLSQGGTEMEGGEQVVE